MANSTSKGTPVSTEIWPSLLLEEWKDTYATLHMWTQVVGKIRLAQTPWVNHSWHVTLYVTSRGMTTSPIPYGTRTFQIDFDFIDHLLVITTNDGAVRTIMLRPISVADFYSEVMTTLWELDLKVSISTKPNEVSEPIHFERDRSHASYDANYTTRFWRVLVQSDRVLKEFRSRFIGKCSPAHFFWGSFDLAVTRFSGRPAPEHPGGVPNLPDSVTREAYSHEVSSCGFWPGGGNMEAAFYAYAYPEPRGFKDYPIGPNGAFYNPDMREFFLPYDAVRQAGNPDRVLLEFLQSTYEAAANLGNWNRSELERMPAEQK
jgi:uncharacterized protein DUF5996